MKSFVSPPFIRIRKAFGLLWIDTADDRRGAFSDAVFIDVYPAGGLGLHEGIAGIDDLTEYGDKASGAQSLLHGSLDHGQAGLIGNNQEDALLLTLPNLDKDQLRNFLPPNSAKPRMYCIGSFFCKRNIMFSNSRSLHSDKIISLPK